MRNYRLSIICNAFRWKVCGWTKVHILESSHIRKFIYPKIPCIQRCAKLWSWQLVLPRNVTGRDSSSRLELTRGFLVSSRRKYRDPFLVSPRLILERICGTRQEFDISCLVSSRYESLFKKASAWSISIVFSITNAGFQQVFIPMKGGWSFTFHCSWIKSNFQFSFYSR